jgi:hypothetical protein
MPSPNAGCIVKKGTATVAIPKISAGRSVGLSIQPVGAIKAKATANPTPME